MNKPLEAKGIKTLINDPLQKEGPVFLRQDEVVAVREFHETLPAYKATPLLSLNNLAKELSLGKIYVKDESYRFGLNAFKALGASYAISKIICEKLGESRNCHGFEYFKNPEIHARIKDMVFVTATDGNHGRAVAWTANKLGCKSIVYMPKGSSRERLNNIKKAGAEAYITDFNYDQSVRIAKKKADDIKGVFVQDTSLPGYEKIPVWISQGYTTMLAEALDQMRLEGNERPSHVFLQAGVGAYPGAILGYMANLFKENIPKTIIVEPDKADCIYRSALRGDGKAHFVTGDMDTIMAGLACGEPNPITWPILRDFAYAFASCPDYVAARGMRVLAAPLANDGRIISGESGAVGLGLLTLIMEKKELSGIKDALGLSKDSVVLCFSTEGDTDSKHYKKVVYDGKNPSI